VTRHLLLGFLIVVTPLLGQQAASPNDAGSSAVHSSGIAQSPQKPQHPRKDVATIAKETKGAVVSIVMADKSGQPIAQGSGFVVTRNGLVVTNYHVIKSGTSAVIKLPDGSFFTVDGVLAFDKDRDIAVIKAHGINFKTVALGDSDRLQVGDEVVAIGSPLSLESTVSNGIVSGIRTEKKDAFDEIDPQGGQKILQITAPISHGSSGGPLFNLAGQVVGITSAALVGGENLNFAVPINDVKKLLVPDSQALLAFPNEPENEPEDHAVGQDPIVVFDDHESTGYVVNFAEAFSIEPTCAGLTFQHYLHADDGFWMVTVYPIWKSAWDAKSGAAPTLLSWLGLDHYGKKYPCSRASKSCRDVDKHFDVYALIQHDRGVDTNDKPDFCTRCTTFQPVSERAGARAVCTLVKGGGGGQVK